jgi:hypothetical protein
MVINSITDMRNVFLNLLQNVVHQFIRYFSHTTILTQRNTKIP